jgi:UDP-N-acetylmuramoyl-L-alanyl-D-glutamate--2,6-diaminopimelate ligase
MRLRALAAALAERGAELIGLEEGSDPEVVDVALDSRRVRPGSLFCCVRGELADGHAFAAEASAAGAVALLVDHRLDVDLPQLIVTDVRPTMAVVAAEVFGHPSEALSVIGITGTNGKTTTAHLLANILIAAGRRVEIIGTLTGARTTPEAPDLQRQLATWREEGVEFVVMEVSSHALALHRVDATRFRVAIFTNLSRDHLDFHGSMEQYFETKALLFRPERSESAVVNLDSPHGRLLDDVGSIPTDGYSVDELGELDGGVDGWTFLWRDHRIEFPLAGSFNLSNALAAAHGALALGLDLDAVARGLATPLVVPGRFERVPLDAAFSVIVDFAHTPDGLEQVLLAADGAVRGVGGRVIVVFGCGGDRDPSKRAPMGEVAARCADIVVVTADNSRSEPTDAIIGEITAGADRVRPRRAATMLVEPDRRAAIGRALGLASPGDILVIAGKGHETTLTIGDTVVPFDDRSVVMEVHSEMGIES